MSNETGKRIAQLERQNDTLYRKIMAESEGSRLDIGAGKWPLPGSESYDLEQGDAQTMTPKPKQESYALVWSSHLLEHLEYPMGALECWWGLVKPLGYLWLLLPDFYLHEHGYWPSRNRKHRWGMSLITTVWHTDFYLYQNGYWPSRRIPDGSSVGIQALEKISGDGPYQVLNVDWMTWKISSCDGYRPMRKTICDEGYDYTRMYDRDLDQSAGEAQVSIEIILQKPG